MLVVYSSWEAEPLVIPPRSRLYHLQPLGLGTPLVESLSSYVARLAQAHHVSISRLVGQELFPLLKGSNWPKAFGPYSLGSWFKHAYTINGLDAQAHRWTQALERLTLHPTLRPLTLLAWSKVLPTKSLLRTTRAWCPACYQTWFNSGQPLYDPLLFTLQAVTLCPIHHQPLAYACPHCQKKLFLLAARMQPGYCSSCKHWLGDTPTDAQTLFEEELAWQNWVTFTIGQLLTAACSLTDLPHQDIITTNLNSYINRLASGNLTALAHQIQLPPSTLTCWFKGSRLPHLTSLIQLAYHLGTTPLHFLTEAAADIPTKPMNFLDGNPFLLKSRRRFSLLVSDKTQNALEKACQQFPPPSLNQTALSFGYNTPQLLRRYYPELCRTISTRYRAYQQDKTRKKD